MSCFICRDALIISSNHSCEEAYEVLSSGYAEIDAFMQRHGIKRLTKIEGFEEREAEKNKELNYEEIEDLDILRDRIFRLQKALEFAIDYGGDLEAGNHLDRIQEGVDNILNEQENY